MEPDSDNNTGQAVYANGKLNNAQWVIKHWITPKGIYRRKQHNDFDHLEKMNQSLKIELANLNTEIHELR